jgi:phospholipid/cholesterol/gamma-HCH transport system permease protein
MTAIFRALGASTLRALRQMGQLAALAIEVLYSAITHRIRWGMLGRQLVAIGFGSQAVVIITGAFIGAVLTAQSYFKFQDFGVESSVGAVVSIAMCRELGPVLTGLMVTGRVGAAMAAEIGTMKVTEQIDALRALGVHPIDYLVVPRTFGILISMPLLIAEAIMFGIIACYVTSVIGFHIPHSWFMTHLLAHTELQDIGIGMIKAFVFGYLIVIISCHRGLATTNGAVGVGRSTTNAVVVASLSILIFNFFLTLLLNFFWPL